MSHSEWWGCIGMFLYDKNKRNLFCDWLKQFPNAVSSSLYWGHCNCVCIATCIQFEMSHNIGDLVCHALSLSLSLSTHIKWAAKKDYHIIQDAGIEDLIWGILHLLSHIAAEQGAYSFTPCCGTYPKRKHWVSGMFNYLVKAQKGFCCPRIKVYTTGGIGNHIWKPCRCSNGVQTKSLMGVLLSRGWHFLSLLHSPELFIADAYPICPSIHTLIYSSINPSNF